MGFLVDCLLAGLGCSISMRAMKTNMMHYLSSVYFVNQPLHVSGTFVGHHQEVYCIYEGGPKKPDFLLKRRFIYISNKKHLIPFKILSIGCNTLVQSFFPLCETSLEVLKLDVVKCLLRSCFHLLHSGKTLSFQCFFFHCRG